MNPLAVLSIFLLSTHAFVIHPTTVRQPGVRLLVPPSRPSSSLKMMDALEPTSLVDMTVAATAAATIVPSSDFSFRNVNVWIFLAGIFPFAWATVEFWRRIAVGEPFGTGTDSVRISIGKDNAPTQSRGRQTLGQGALVVAYILFGLAAGTIGLTLYSVLTSTSPTVQILTDETLWLP